MDDHGLPPFPLFTVRFAGSFSVQEMTGPERGAYMLLLMAQWQSRGRGLPVDESRLRRLIAHSEEEWASVRSAVLPMFEDRDGRLYNRRCAETWDEAVRRQESAARAGRISGRKRRESSDADERIANGTGNGSRTEQGTDRERKGQRKGQRKRRKARGEAREEVEEDAPRTTNTNGSGTESERKGQRIANGTGNGSRTEQGTERATDREPSVIRNPSSVIRDPLTVTRNPERADARGGVVSEEKPGDSGESEDRTGPGTGQISPQTSDTDPSGRVGPSLGWDALEGQSRRLADLWADLVSDAQIGQGRVTIRERLAEGMDPAVVERAIRNFAAELPKSQPRSRRPRAHTWWSRVNEETWTEYADEQYEPRRATDDERRTERSADDPGDWFA